MLTGWSVGVRLPNQNVDNITPTRCGKVADLLCNWDSLSYDLAPQSRARA